MASTTADTPSPPIRRPYHGSCHCGRIRYVVVISLPTAALAKGGDTARFVKCNCGTCHKLGFFHLRAPNPPTDFYLLSPLDLSSLSDYQCNRKIAHWYFCSNCGVRCFTLAGEGEVAEIDLEAALGKESEGNLTKVWRCKEEGWFNPDRPGYLSINAHTIESGQEGFDLRELVDKRLLVYVDFRDQKGEARSDYPHEGGTW